MDACKKFVPSLYYWVQFSPSDQQEWWSIAVWDYQEHGPRPRWIIPLLYVEGADYAEVLKSASDALCVIADKLCHRRFIRTASWPDSIFKDAENEHAHTEEIIRWGNRFAEEVLCHMDDDKSETLKEKGLV